MSALLLALLAPAHAESVLEFKAAAPVAIFVDGQQATLTSNLKQRVGGLDAGVHALRVAGMFGKTLYEAEIDIPDGTITQAEWDHGEIKVTGTEWLDVEEEEEAADEDTGAGEVLEVAAPEAPPVQEPGAEVPLAIPAEAPAVAAAPPVEAVPPVVAPAATPAAATALASVQRPRTLTVQATDGMRIDVVHEGRTLSIVIDGDTFRIEDPSGAVLALGAE